MTRRPPGAFACCCPHILPVDGKAKSKLGGTYQGSFSTRENVNSAWRTTQYFVSLCEQCSRNAQESVGALLQAFEEAGMFAAPIRSVTVLN